jgi:hypothetical protein
MCVFYADYKKWKNFSITYNFWVSLKLRLEWGGGGLLLASHLLCKVLHASVCIFMFRTCHTFSVLLHFFSYLILLSEFCVFYLWSFLISSNFHLSFCGNMYYFMPNVT